MASCDDPPFLTVGTEVSAKYRGAFCEATIKVAKKLVKCKVSYGFKGQTAVVNNDVIKGPLKIGSQVEVKQTDGQFLTATITKLTDQSTYTVVFDDGDERTLKRSSLCLKGARHFHESESLDNQPLTDPENFGAPVNLSKKSNRKRRRLSLGSAQTDEMSPKKKCSYPSEFLVGKAVFLENDRRRSCWLPAVIVPAHYVMDESEMNPDNICLRSFKDGRFFVATKNELHDFSPDKEPLLSMLDGEIQAMYMCKPAIERAMAYLDTGELPWDMDLFDRSSEHPVPRRLREHISSDKEEEPSIDLVAAERDQFMKNYNSFMEAKGTPVSRSPIIGQKDLDLFRLYKLVQENGGMERVSHEMKWRSIYLQLGLSPMPNASFVINRSYKRYMYSYEMYEKGKGQKNTKGLSNVSNPKCVIATDNASGKEHNQHTPKQAKGNKPATKITRNSKIEKPEPKVKTATPDKVHTKPDKPKAPSPKVEKPVKSEKPAKPVKLVAKDTPMKESASEDDDLLSLGTDIKSELSDMDLSAVENSSSNGDEPAAIRRRTGAVECPNGYVENDHVFVWYGKGKSLRTYQAKIQGVEESESGRSYLVHYNGWNNRYDEWIEEKRLAGKVAEDMKQSRPRFSKKKVSKNMSSESTMPPPGQLPPLDSPPSHAPLPLPNGTTPAQHSKHKPESCLEALIKMSPRSLVAIVKLSPQGKSKTPAVQLAKEVANKSAGGIGKNGRPTHWRAKKRMKSQESIDGSNTSSPESPHPTISEPQENRLAPSTPKAVALTPPPSTHAPVESLPKSEPCTQSVASTPGGGALWANSVSVPPAEDAINMEEAIEVKREENTNWTSPRGSTSSSGSSSSSGHGTLTSSGSEMGDVEVVQRRDLGELAAVAAVADALVCSEKIPGMVSLKVQPDQTTPLHPDQTTPLPPDQTTPHKEPDMFSPHKEDEANLTLNNLFTSADTQSHYVHSTHGSATTNSLILLARDLSGEESLVPSLYASEHSPLAQCLRPHDSPTSNAEPTNTAGNEVPVHISNHSDSRKSSMESMSTETADDTESDKTTPPLSDPEATPPSKVCEHVHDKSKRSRSPDGKQKWKLCETSDEYEARRVARREELNFHIDFLQLPEMSREERTSLIQKKIKELQSRWNELRTEVAYLERKKRKARRKEKEFARVQANQLQSSTASKDPSSPLPNPVECH